MKTQNQGNGSEANDLLPAFGDARQSHRRQSPTRHQSPFATLGHRKGRGVVTAVLLLSLIAWGCNSTPVPQPTPTGGGSQSPTQTPGGSGGDPSDGPVTVPDAGPVDPGTIDPSSPVEPAEDSESKAPDMPDMDDDGDGDGVLTYMDACPNTPPGAELLEGGCSAVDIVLAPEVVLDPVARAVDESAEVLETGEDFQNAAHQLVDVKTSLEAAARRLRIGDVCGDPEPARFADRISNIRLNLDTQVLPGVISKLELGAVFQDLHFKTELANRQKLNPILLPGLITLFAHDEAMEDEHASPAMFSRVFVDLGMSLVDEAELAAADAKDVFDSVCDAKTETARLQGVIVRIDDARNMLEMEDGTILALAEREYSEGFSEGQEVFIDADLFRDGTGIARSVELVNAENVSDAIIDALNECLTLKVAPIQPMPVGYVGPYTLHSPWGYRHTDGRFWFEEGMRFAVTKGPCAGIGEEKGDDLESVLKFTRYSMKIDLRWVQNEQFTTKTIAHDLDTGDAPVAFSLPFGDRTLIYAWLDTTTRKQECIRTLDAVTCGAFESVSTNSLPLVVRPRGGFAEAVYESTKFDLEDDDMTSFRSARVKEVVLGTPAGNAAFEAKGWLVNGSTTSRDQGQLRIIRQGDPFAIYNEDIIDDYLFPMDVLGVNTRSGLVWPRVTGTRNGQPYSYSCRIPRKLVRDVVNFCPSQVPSMPGVPVPFPDETYYRLPFNPGSPIWTMGNGNWRESGAGHCGTAGFEQCLQRFAFDFGGPEGTDILAARGGVVTRSRGDSNINAWQCGLDRRECFKNGGTDCATQYQCDIGNYIFIRHQDGSYGIYWHFRKDGVFVQPGDVVHRGDVIGENGNTGNSTGPHLHFHVQESPNIDGGFSIPVLFETVTEECDRIDNNDALLSTNH